MAQGEERRTSVRAWRKAAASDTFRKIREFLYGMSAFEFERQALEIRGELESAFMLITLGDMLGVQVVPPIYSLRIVHYEVPNIKARKRSVSRDRDVAVKE